MSDPRDLPHTGNILANPYPLPAAGLSDEAQLGKPPAPPRAPASAPDDDEPVFVLRARSPLSAMLLRCWAGLVQAYGLEPPQAAVEARTLAASMDEWRKKRGGR